MINAMDRAGRDLTTAKLVEEMEEVSAYADPFGGPTISFSAEKHQAVDSIYLSQVVDGKWTLIQKDLPF